MTTAADDFVAPVCLEEIEILFQDESILLLNKPSGLLSLSGKNPLNYDSVHYRITQQFPSAAMVHRLDLGTSGIMVLALNKAVNAHLCRQFQDRKVVKTYVSLLNGHLKNNKGLVKAPIAKDKENFPLQKICAKSGKQAISHYEVLSRGDLPVISRVLFTPHTGRTHQLRIHAREMGHPILGCDLYGTPQTQAMADRLMLHATSISFEHPVSGENIVADCRCPF